MNKFYNIKKVVTKYPYHDSDDKKDLSLIELKISRFLYLFKTNFFIFLLHFNTFRSWCLTIFNPDINTKKNILFWLGCSIRISLLIISLSFIFPLMFNNLFPQFESLSKVMVFFIAALYFLRWMTSDLKQNANKISNKMINFIIYPIRFSNILMLSSWIIPMILIYGDIQFQSKENVIFLFLLVFLVNIYNELQYMWIFNGLLVLNFVFQKNWKIILMLIISLLIMVLIFSVIVLNIEKIFYNPNLGVQSPILIPGYQGWFNSFWLCFITFTTIGYGDILPVTDQAKVVIMISAIFGIAFYSLFTSIIVNGFIQYLDKLKIEEQERREAKYREAVNELNTELEKNKISKTIYNIKLKKVQDDIKNNRRINKKSIKLKSINRKNLLLKKK